MNNIRIENYQPEFIDQQISLVKEATKSWNYFNYPTKEQLLQGYNVDNFTAHTRYYAFEGDELVGFLSSAFEKEEGKANLQYPFVREGYEELQKVLLEKAFQTFREAGVTEIRNNQQSTWVGAREFMEQFDFSFDKVMAKHIFVKTAELDTTPPQVTTEYIEVNLEEHREELLRVFSSEMTQSDEEILAIMDNWKNQDHLKMNTISLKDGKVVTHSMVYEHTQDPTLAQMTHISIYDESVAERRLEQQAFMFHKLKTMGYQTIQVFAIPLDQFDSYQVDHFDTRKSYRMIKTLAPLQTV